MYGFGYRGASSCLLTKEEALKLLPKYSFGMGFYSLSYCRDTRVVHEQSGPNCTVTETYGDVVLMFNELSENDLW